MKRVICLFFGLFLAGAVLDAQQHNSISLDSDVYTVIESAVIRGILRPPSSAKPWSLAAVKEMLLEILNAETSPSDREIDIIRDMIESLERKEGIDRETGRYYSETSLKNGTRFSFESGLAWGTSFSVRVPTTAFGSVNMGTFYIAGDMGDSFSWNFSILGGFLYVDRDYLGERLDPPYIDTKYGRPSNPYGATSSPNGHEYYYDVPSDKSYSNVYDIPAWFPGTFSKMWEAAVFPPSDLGGYHVWPDRFAFAYEMISEINASFWERRLEFRFGRMRRDWGPEGNGTSLVLNAMARPFIALEGTALPLGWLRFSFLTGALEYMKISNQWMDADPFQNFFSLAMLEFNPNRHFHIGFGSATVWPKRFELGYIFPINSNYFYQNNTGDFDNLALFGNIEFRWPGKFKIWGSLYLDEARFDLNLSDFFHMDRNMYAIQGGLKADIPWLPFASLTLRYTKIEPYCYTHEYTETPWNRVPIDTAYLNNGESLGFYLPPNSDEALIRIESMFLPGTRAHFQYQMIRHGVDYGSGRVDGSSLGDKIYKDANTEKSFLKDGVYRWDHVLKVGATWSLRTRKIPVSVFAETGVVITRYTRGGKTTFDDDGTNATSGYITNEDFGEYRPINTPEYPSRAGFILSIGFRVFP
jgi:hypothetical protein